jgi:ABC-type dipeptide/oligopeptide/nickel transport system ATPase subunit
MGDASTPVAAGAELCVRYGHAPPVFAGINVAVHHGEILGIQGPSGCGKSTLLRVLASIQKPTHGAVRYHGTPVTKIVRTGYVMTVEQNTAGALDPRWPIWRTITEPLGARHRTGRPSMSRRRAVATEQLATVGLDGVDIEARPAELSGGQRQRVAILRALIAQPSLLIADEPTAALDVSVSAGILQLLSAAADTGLAIVVASHNRLALQALCTHVCEFRPGGMEVFGGDRPVGPTPQQQGR